MPPIERNTDVRTKSYFFTTNAKCGRC